MDGTPRQFLRINNDVYCHLPDGKHVRLERNTSRRFFPALLPAQPAGLLEYYEAKLGGTERVAGRACQVVILEPRDGYRYAYQPVAGQADRIAAQVTHDQRQRQRGVDVCVLRNSDWQSPDAQIFRQ